MKINNLPEFPRITLAELSKLHVDVESARRFERRFAPALLGGTALVFGGMGGSIALHHFALIHDLAFALGMIGSFLSGLATVLRAHHCMMRARPRSLRSGQTMEPFIIQDIETSDRYELAYVDRASGTFFRREYVERGG